MNAIRNNRIIVDLTKCQHAISYWRNQFGQHSVLKPNVPTVRGKIVSPLEPALFHPSFPGETMLQRATRLQILDDWHFECQLKLHAGGYLVYTNEKGLAIMEAWNARIFGQKKKKQKSPL